MDIETLAVTHDVPLPLAKAATAAGARMAREGGSTAPLSRIGVEVIMVQPEVVQAMRGVRASVSPDALEHLATIANSLERSRRGIQVCGLGITSDDDSAMTVALALVAIGEDFSSNRAALCDRIAMEMLRLQSPVTITGNGWSTTVPSTNVEQDL